MRLIKILAVSFVAMSSQALADLYKCVSGSVTTYQQTECSSGAQKLIAKQPKAQVVEEVQKSRKAAVLKECLVSKDCSPSLYVGLVKSLQVWENVRDSLGTPNNVQVFRGEETHYFMVPSSTGKTMLQIHYTPGMVIKDVSAY